MSNLQAARLLLLFGFLIPVRSATAGVLADLPGIDLIGVEEVLAEYTATSSDGELVFRQADGAWVRLVTTTEDPEIRNSGEGAFFPASISEVETAIRAIPSELLTDVRVKVFLLPYPRSGMLGSSADGLGIYLTPGVRAYTRDEIHYLVAHELGHAFHRVHMPYGDRAWDRYRQLRGLGDAERFSFDGPHVDRPQEIFAEDFRVLFGGAFARTDGSIENAALLRPEEVPGLAQFFLGFLEGGEPTPPSGLAVASDPPLRVFPNPVSPGGRLTLRVPAGVEVRSALVFDASGRRVGSASPETSRAEAALVLEPSLPPGAYWLRLDLMGSATRTIPIRVAG